MDKVCRHIIWVFVFQLFLVGCESPSKQKKSKESLAVESAQLVDSAAVEKKSNYESILKKFKRISFDTLKVYYDSEESFFSGKQLSYKEARFLPVEVYQDYNEGAMSGIFACYQFEIDPNRIGLIARTPSEYESSSIKLFVFDQKADKVKHNWIELGQTFGDAGDYLFKASWLFRTKKREIHAFIYSDLFSDDIFSEDTVDQIQTHWNEYVLINCMTQKFDTISKNEVQLKKRFRSLLKTEE